MRIVPADHRKGGIRCAVTGKTSDPNGFIETGQILNGWDQEVNVSIAAVSEMARMLGHMNPEEANRLIAANQTLVAENRRLIRRIEKLETFVGLRKELEVEDYAAA